MGGFLMPSCEKRIYSNDYYSALLDFWPLDEEINLISPDFCYMKISDILGVLVIDKKILTSLSLRIIPIVSCQNYMRRCRIYLFHC